MKRFFAVLSVLVLISACGTTATAKPATNNTTELNLDITPTLNGTEVKRNFYVEIQNIKDLENIEILHSSVSKLPGKIKLEVNNISKNPEYMVKIISEEYIGNYIIHPKPNTKTQKHKIPIKPTPKQIKKNIQEKGGIKKLNSLQSSKEYTSMTVLDTEKKVTRVGELHTINGVRNRIVINENNNLRIQSYMKYGSNDWENNGLRSVESVVTRTHSANKDESGIKIVEANVEYEYTVESSQIGPIYYIFPNKITNVMLRIDAGACYSCGDITNDQQPNDYLAKGDDIWNINFETGDSSYWKVTDINFSFGTGGINLNVGASRDSNNPPKVEISDVSQDVDFPNNCDKLSWWAESGDEETWIIHFAFDN